jgi:predicted unusual protein kinase regulating ubiquinone biosynthesis (AarF/ABC1/UbiB family)
MVGRVTPGMQESLTKLLLSVSEGRAEDAASVAIQISETSDEFDETTFRRRIGELVTEMRERSLRRMDVGRMLLEVSRSSGAAGLYAPSELTMLGKTLLQLHQIGKHLEPSFNPNDAVRRHVDVYLNKRLQKDLTPGNLFSTLLEAKGFLGRLPGRVNKVFDRPDRVQTSSRRHLAIARWFSEDRQPHCRRAGSRSVDHRRGAADAGADSV